MYNYFFKKTFAYPIVISTFIIYVYFLKINFPPYYLILPYLFLGLGVFFFEIIKTGIKKKYLFYFGLVFISFLWAMFSYVYNFDSDFFYIRETLLISLIYFFSAFGVRKIFDLLGLDFNLETILKFSILAILFQLLISLFANFSPYILNLFISFFNIDGLSLESASSFMEARFIGIGASFFGSGIITSFFLILLSYFINTYCERKNYFFYMLVYVFFIIIGLLFSRTTVIGVLLSVLFFINAKNIIRVMVLGIPTIILLLFLIKILIASNDKFSFGLDFLFDFKKSQASSSVGMLTEMYNILPNKLETWILGDSKYKKLSNGAFLGYYKDTDIGYFRIIFSNGIVGLLLFIILNTYIVFKSFKSGLLCLLLLLCFLILNVKGVANMYFFCFLFFIINDSNSLILKKGR